jgi:hypothetical protein
MLDGKLATGTGVQYKEALSIQLGKKFHKSFCQISNKKMTIFKGFIPFQNR